MSASQPSTIRGRKLAVAMPDAALARQLRRAHPQADSNLLAAVASMPGMSATVAASYLDPQPYAAFEKNVLPRYDQLNDLQASAERLADAVMRGEKIAISGDYDCDGNCSTALMVRFLQESGQPREKIEVHIPNRKTEGYGVNQEAVERMKAKGVSLLLTLDNGTLAHKPLALAHAHGMDALVIDHHPNQEYHELPLGARVVNPRRHDEALRDDPLGVGDMAAVGVTWLVCRKAAEILQERGYYRAQRIAPPKPQGWLGLVALATQADVVKLSPVNVALMQEGVKLIRSGGDPYIAALAKAAGIADLKKLTEEDISFRLGPIINAPGRLKQSVAWNFLCAPEATSTPFDALLHGLEAESRGLADYLAQHQVKERFRLPAAQPGEHAGSVSDGQYALMVASVLANERRKQVEQTVLSEARPMARAWLAAHPDSGTLTLLGDGWHEGVVGIVAGRLKEEFNLPTFVATRRPDGSCKASARSTDPAADMGAAIHALVEQGVLTSGGGHPMAAGAGFAAEKFPQVRDGLEASLAKASHGLRETSRTALAGALDLSTAERDGIAPLKALRQWAQWQEGLRPFGAGRPKPLIGLHGMAIAHVRRSANGRDVHFEIKPRVSFNGQDAVAGVAFRAAGTEIETALMEAAGVPLSPQLVPLAGADPAQPATPLLVGTIAEETDKQGALRFLLDDVLRLGVPPRNPVLRRGAIARALGCDESQLTGLLKPAGPARG